MGLGWLLPGQQEEEEEGKNKWDLAAEEQRQRVGREGAQAAGKREAEGWEEAGMSWLRPG